MFLGPGKHTVSKYWDFDPAQKIRYQTDAEYEEDFRAVFAKAVQRRLRSNGPVLAHLSGGMDSSSIVCMADTIIARESAECPRLDTISWYDDSNPGLDERPYFTKVEAKRGRVGFHIDLGSLRPLKEREVNPQRNVLSDYGSHRLMVTPFPSRLHDSRGLHEEFFKEYERCLVSNRYRVVLSGVGGDDVMGGGVPTPRPELQNLLASARFLPLARQLNAWAVKMRKPRLPLLREAVRGFFKSYSVGTGFSENPQPPFWLDTAFVRRNRDALRGYPSKIRLFGPLPSFQNHMATLDVLRRIMAFIAPREDVLCETRYPYLDRSLLEFMYAVPREQIVRLGQRRSLMKRALVKIVPAELLGRRQKAVISRELKEGRSDEYPRPTELAGSMLSNSIGIVDINRFAEALQKAELKEEGAWASLTRTLVLESWLRQLEKRGLLTHSMSRRSQIPVCVEVRRALSAESGQKIS